MKSLFLEQFNTTIAYHDLNYGPFTVVYLAGLNMPSLINFQQTATHENIRRHRAILVDYLGTGHSERPADFSHSMSDHAQTVAAILDKEGIENCIIVGHSMGGTVGIYLAHQRPELVSHLIVCEGNLTPGGGAATQQFSSFTEDEFAQEFFPKMIAQWRDEADNGDKRAQFLWGAWVGVDFSGIHRSSCALVDLEPGFKQQFFDLPMRRTFVYGENSLPENTGKVTADAPDPRELQQNGIDVAVLEGAGHELMRTNLDGFVDILNGAL